MTRYSTLHPLPAMAGGGHAEVGDLHQAGSSTCGAEKMQITGAIVGALMSFQLLHGASHEWVDEE